MAMESAELFVQRYLNGYWKGTEEIVSALESEAWEKWMVMMTLVEAEDASCEDETKAISDAYHILLINAFKIACALDTDQELYMELSKVDDKGLIFFRELDNTDKKKYPPAWGHILKMVFEKRPTWKINLTYSLGFLFHSDVSISKGICNLYSQHFSRHTIAISLECPYAIQVVQLERHFRKRWIQHEKQKTSSGNSDSENSKGNRFLVTKIRELTKQVAEGKEVIERLEQRVRRLESQPVVATATICGSSTSSESVTLDKQLLEKQLLEMGFTQKEVLTIPSDVTDVEEAANFLFSK